MENRTCQLKVTGSYPYSRNGLDTDGEEAAKVRVAFRMD